MAEFEILKQIASQIGGIAVLALIIYLNKRFIDFKKELYENHFKHIYKKFNELSEKLEQISNEVNFIKGKLNRK